MWTLGRPSAASDKARSVNFTDLHKSLRDIKQDPRSARQNSGFCRNFYLRRFEVSSSSLSNRASGERATMAISFKGAHFPSEVILMGVRWYVAYPLSRHCQVVDPAV